MANLPRLAGCANVLPSDQPIHVVLTFGKDQQGIVFVEGAVEATIHLQCQRCMDPFVYAIHSHFRLGVVNSLDEAGALPASYEPVLTVASRRLALREAVEDELMLKLPIIARHALEECKVNASQMSSLNEQKEKKNPFQVLVSLKDRKQ